MYADRYAKPTRFNPGGLTAAIAINAALVAALMFAGPKILPGEPDHVLITDNIPLDPPPPPPPEPKPAEAVPHRPVETVYAPIPPIPMPVQPNPITTTSVESPPTAGAVIGKDIGPAVEAPVAPPPAPLPFVGPSIDSRYADAFQPDYPAVERRANRDGRVSVRVLVGADGRVKQIEQVSATSDAFWRATREQALKAWRFRPATRGTVPVEAWRTMTLTFLMENAD